MAGPFFFEGMAMSIWAVAMLVTSLASTGIDQSVLQTRPDPDAYRVDDVTVDAQRFSESALRAHVESFTRDGLAPPSRRTLARWTKPVCIGTQYIAPSIARSMIDHIAQRMVEVGVDVGEPGCKADMLILGSDDGALMARGLVSKNPQSFRPARAGTDRGSAALRRFQQGDAPVRWWHVNLLVSVEDGRLAMVKDGGGEPTNFFVDGDRDISFDAPAIETRIGSRLSSAVRNDLSIVVVIVDFTKLKHIEWNSLLDYIAFVSMAQVDSEFDFHGYDTILGLFEVGGERRPVALTEFDMQYLKAMYSVRSHRPNASMQRRDISEQVVRERRRQGG